MAKTWRPVLVCLGVFLITGLGSTMEKFDWLASDSAPQNYPMTIVNGDLILSNGGSLYIPDTRVLRRGWGEMESSHVVGPDTKPLPTKMEITFFSYTENAFYQGSFDLPYDDILALFRAGYYSPKKREETTYGRIVTGVAPGGEVALWLMGTDRQTEVFYGRAEKVDFPWKEYVDNPEISREDFVRITLEGSLSKDALANLESEGIPLGRWGEYRKLYNWQPVVDSNRLPGLINLVSYFNGELDYLRYPLEDSIANAERPIPDQISFIWRNSKGKSYWVKYYFDENEIFEVFDKLASDGSTALELVLKVEELPEGRTISSWLRNQDEAVKLEKTGLESPATGLTDEEIDSM